MATRRELRKSQRRRPERFKCGILVGGAENVEQFLAIRYAKGSCSDYVRNLHKKLGELGIADDEVTAFLAAMEPTANEGVQQNTPTSQ